MLKSSSPKRIQEEDKHFKSESSYTPLHQAAIAGDDAAVEALLVNGVDRFAKDNKVRRKKQSQFCVLLKMQTIFELMIFELMIFQFLFFEIFNCNSMETPHYMKPPGVDIVAV